MRYQSKLKKRICGLLALLQTAAMLAPAAMHASARDTGLTGDINRDGLVDSADLTLLSGHVAQIAPITDDAALQNADLTGDGILSAADMTALAALLEENEDSFSIGDVSVNQTAGKAGSVFEWSVDTQGGTGAVEYEFQLVDAQGNAVVARQAFSPADSFCVRIMEAGDYALTVTCKDEEGRTHTLSGQAQVTVSASALQIHSVNYSSADRVYPGQELRWFIQTSGGVLPYRYQYTLLRDGTPILSTESTESVYTYQAERAGTYTLQVTCTDSNGTAVQAGSAGATVDAVPEAPSGAPAPAPENPEYTLANTAEAAGYIPVEELRFRWEQMDRAAVYEVILEAQAAEGWTEVLCQSVSEAALRIASNMIVGWDANTLFRLRIVAQGMATGEESISYFYTRAGQESVAIDHSDNVKWNIAGAEATVRSFSVSASGPWTATADAAWITVTPEEQGFLAQVSQNTDAERSGIITVSDGVTAAYVRVTQGIGNGAPELTYPVYSIDPDSPSEIPLGGMILGFDPMDARYVSVRILEKSAAGRLTEVYQGFAPEKEKYHQVVTDYDFRVNTDYVIELTGCVKEEPDTEAPKNFYYVRMTDKPHRILLEGSSEYVIDSFTDFSVALFSTGAWTYTSDAPWLCPEDYNDVSYQKDYQTVKILLQPNETYDTRTGTITFTCGDASATLTVTQKSCLPHFIKPANVSQDERNPTVLPRKGFAEMAIYQTGTYSVFENGAWSEETGWGSNSDINEWCTLYPDDFFRADVLYRFTMHIADRTAVYYAKFSDAVHQPYAVMHQGVEDFIDFTLPFTAAKSEELLELSTSGAWSIVSDASWLSVSAASGTAAVSEKEITVTAEANSTGQVRTGTLTVRSENQICATVTVTQAARDHMMLFLKDDSSDYVLYDPDTSFKNLDGSKNYVYFRVESPLAHTVTSPDSWITCKKTSLTLAANTTGQPRTGTVVISSGTAEQIITVTQEPQLALPTLDSPSLSTTQSAPSVMENGDMDFTFHAVKGAVRYVVCVGPADQSLLLPGNKFYSFYTQIQADGSAKYTCRIPRSAFSVDNEDSDYISVLAYDAFGYFVDEDFFVKTTSTGAALINGTTAPLWDNATDIAVSGTFTVRSTAAWQAVSRSSWITLDKTGGSDGDALTLTLQANTGPARTGQVLITVGTSETVLTVNQCGWLPEYPSIASPVFSDDPAIPTVIGDGTTSLQVSWDYEPQAEYYKVFLLSFKSNSVQHIEASSPKLHTGEYTFENLILEPGQRYSLKITRKSHWGNTAKSYFFTLSDENAYVLADDLSAAEVEMEGGEDFDALTVTSSGIWSAGVSDSWILVDNERIKQADMALEGSTPEDYDHYSGRSGDDLYISVLPNTTGTFRRGTVTLRCGNAESTVTVIQEPCYTTAEIHAPQLANTRQSSTSLPYGPVTLRWAGAEGGTGAYRLVLYERDAEKEYRYYEIKEFDNITKTSYTIPQSLLTEGQYYKLWLGTGIPGTEDYPGHWYYFRTGYENELVASVATDWGTVGSDGFVSVHASASGGAGGYRFSYELLHNGRQVSITELDEWEHYTFNIREVGNYQVRVYVRDAANQGANSLSGSYTVGEAEVAPLKLSQSQWQIGASGGSTAVTAEAYSTWKIAVKPDWITCSAPEGASGTAVTLTAAANSGGERSGYVTFSGSGKSASIFLLQEGNPLAAPALLYPGAGETLDLQDIGIRWNAVSGAGYYIFKLRDLTADTPVLQETDLTETGVTLPAGLLLDGHTYKISIGAARSGEAATSSSIAWAEGEFRIAASRDLVTTVSGSVTDSLGNPLPEATVRVVEIDGDGYCTALSELETNAAGRWEIAGLKRGGTYGFTVSAAGYLFASDAITVTATQSNHDNLVFRAENHREPAVLYPQAMDFGDDAAAEPLYINLSGKWTATTDASWLTLSAGSGTDAGEIQVAVSGNPGDTPREGTVLITDQSGTVHTLSVYQEEPVKEIHVAHKAGTSVTADSIFDADGKYTGAVPTANTPYTFNWAKKYVIDKDLTIPKGTTLTFNGEVIIRAKVTFEADLTKTVYDYASKKYVTVTTARSEISTTGDLTVASDGILDMHAGGKIRIDGDFTFKPKEKHDTELSNGIIQVGGDLNIRRNYYSNTGHQVHLFKSSPTKATHKVDVADNWGDKNDQVINALYLGSQSLAGLDLKRAFQCNKLDLGNLDGLKKRIVHTDAYNRRSSVFIFTPINTDGVSLSTFNRLSSSQQDQVLNNLHAGLVRLMAEGRFEGGIVGQVQSSDTFTYINANNQMQEYTLVIEGWRTLFKLAPGTSVRYIENGIGSIEFMYGEQLDEIQKTVDEWYAIIKKEQTDKATEAYKSIYQGILTDMIWGALGKVTNLKSCFETASEAEGMLGELAEHNSELQDIYKLMGALNPTAN